MLQQFYHLWLFVRCVCVCDCVIGCTGLSSVCSDALGKSTPDKYQLPAASESPAQVWIRDLRCKQCYFWSHWCIAVSLAAAVAKHLRWQSIAWATQVWLYRPRYIAITTLAIIAVFGRPYYRSRLCYIMSSVCLSVVCDVLYPGETVHPGVKVSIIAYRKSYT